MALMRRVGVLALGTALGQGCVLLATPLLARLYTPAQFGELALFLTLATYAAAAGCLRYDLALSSHKESSGGSALLGLCLVIAAGMALLCGALAALPWRQWTQSDLAVLGDHPVWVALAVASVAMYQAVLSELIRLGRFTQLALARALQGVLFAVLPFLTALVGLVGGLVGSYAVASAAGLRQRERQPWRLADLAAAARQHRQFPLLMLPGALLDALACSAVVAVISNTYGLAQLGQYTQIQRLVGAPLLLISASLFQVYLRQSTEDHKSGRPLMPLMVHTFKRVVGVTVVLMLGIGLLGADVLSWLLGQGWRADTYFLLVCTGALALRVCVSPFSSILVTTGRLRQLLFWQGLYFASSFVALPLLAGHTDFDRFLGFYVLHEALLYGVYLYLIVSAARAPAGTQ